MLPPPALTTLTLLWGPAGGSGTPRDSCKPLGPHRQQWWRVAEEHCQAPGGLKAAVLFPVGETASTSVVEQAWAPPSTQAPATLS